MSEYIARNGLVWDEAESSDLLKSIQALDFGFYREDLTDLVLLGGIKFSDDLWDFTKYDQLHRPKWMLNYDFSAIDFRYKDRLKKFVIDEVFLKQNELSTLYNKFYRIVKVFDFLLQKGIVSANQVTKVVAERFCESLRKDVLENNRRRYREMFRTVCTIFELEAEPNLVLFRDIYKYLNDLDRQGETLLTAQAQAGKTPRISEDVFNYVIACALKDIQNHTNGVTTLTREEIIGSCMVLLLSQIGMRIGELRLLEAGKLKVYDPPKEVGEDTVPTCYLEFKTNKTTNEHNDFTDTVTYMNKISTLAYKTFEKVTEDIRAKLETTYLFCSTNPEHTDKILTDFYLDKYLAIFYLRNIHELECLNRPVVCSEGFHKAKIYSERARTGKELYCSDSKYYENLPIGSIVRYPNPHQYRVTVCNELFKKGVHYDWIRIHMNHLSEDMTNWYLRKEDTDKKVIQFNEEILEGLIRKDFRLIGQGAEEITTNINEFIARGVYNLVEDRNKFLKALKKQLPIREKALGFCIKSSFSYECASNELVCAFDKCINHYTYYKVAHLTYQRFLGKKEAIRHNQQHGFKRQAENETNNLKELIRKRLIPELEEVRYEVNRQGLAKVTETNPQLILIIENLDFIMEEAKQWIA